jgi:hypothetical protein
MTPAWKWTANSCIPTTPCCSVEWSSLMTSRMLKRTFRTLPLDATASEIAEVRETYPHHHLEHPYCLWFSWIDRYMPGYEIPYGYWVPGNAKDALMAVFLLGGELWREVIDALRRLA